MRKERKRVKTEHIVVAMDILHNALNKRIKKHGSLSFITKHESLGVITEEYFELIAAVKMNDQNEYDKEIIDIGVTTIFTIASEISYLQKRTAGLS